MEQLQQMQAKGLSLRQIAQAVGVSKSTISTYLHNCVQNMSEKYQDAMSPPGGSQGRPEVVVDPRASQVAKTIMKQEKGGGSPMAQAAHRKKEHMKERFLQALEQKFSVARAAKLAGVPRRTVYKWRESDAIFGEEWDDRREGHLDAIEDAMMEGALKMTQSYHAVLALGMLNAHRSELYSPKHRVEHSGVGGGPILLAVAAKIKLMDTEELRSELGKLLGPSLVEVQGPKPES